MSNYRRAHFGQTYFFTVVTHLRQPILTGDTARRILRESINSVRANLPFDIVAFVLLPDHLHTIWSLPKGDVDYSLRWQKIKATFSKNWLKSGGRSRPVSESRKLHGEVGVWQKRYYEHTCRNDEDLRRCADYIHVNPLKHGLVEHVRDWPWSSFHRYVKLGEYSDGWGSEAEWIGDEFKDFE